MSVLTEAKVTTRVFLSCLLISERLKIYALCCPSGWLSVHVNTFPHTYTRLFTLLGFCLPFPKNEAKQMFCHQDPLIETVLQLLDQESYLTDQPMHHLHV